MQKLPTDYSKLFDIHTDSNGLGFLNLYDSIIIGDNINPDFYSDYYFSDGDDFYSLANKFYENHRLWWIILLVNRIDNPFEFTGGLIKIPNQSLINIILDALNNK